MTLSAEYKLDLLANLSLPAFERTHNRPASRCTMKAVLMVIAAHDGQMLACRAIADRLCISPDTVAKNVYGLEQLGLLRSQFDDHHRVYRLSIDWRAVQARQNETPLCLPRHRPARSSTEKNVKQRAYHRAKRVQAVASMELARTMGDTCSAVDEVDAIISCVCKYLNVTREGIKGREQRPAQVIARMFVAGLARELTTASFPEIAHAMQRTTHSTVILFATRYAAKKTDGGEEFMRQHKDLREQCRAAIEVVRGGRAERGAA